MRSRTLLGTLGILLTAFVATAPAKDRPINVSKAIASADCDGNGIEDALEIESDPVLDANYNGRPDRCEGLSVDRLQISIAQGGTQRFQLDLGPVMAGRIYWILGTTAGDAPGMKFGYAKLPLNYDGERGYMEQTLQRPNAGRLTASLGVLDIDGRANGFVTVEPGFDPSLAGLRVHHSFVIIEPLLRSAVWASNSVSLDLLP